MQDIPSDRQPVTHLAYVNKPSESEHQYYSENKYTLFFLVPPKLSDGNFTVHSVMIFLAIVSSGFGSLISFCELIKI